MNEGLYMFGTLADVRRVSRILREPTLLREKFAGR